MAGLPVPKGLRHSAQGWRPAPTLGTASPNLIYPERVAPCLLSLCRTLNHRRNSAQRRLPASSSTAPLSFAHRYNSVTADLVLWAESSVTYLGIKPPRLLCAEGLAWQ